MPEDMSSVSIDNLEAGTAYSVSVRGNTRAGAGVSSDILISGEDTYIINFCVNTIIIVDVIIL